MPMLTLKWPKYLDLLFPPRCAVCGEVTPIGTALCPECQLLLPEKLFKAKRCGLCGKPLESCVCRERPFYFTRCIAAFCYEKNTHFLIERLKSEPKSPVTQQIAVLMAQAFVDFGFAEQYAIDAVTEVPMHPDNIKKRGHNQAETLAQTLSTLLGLRYLPSPLCCTKEKQTQHTLSYGQRIQNAQKGYQRQVGATCSGGILLIDDVMTTGATLDRCAQLLLECGADKVYGLTAATTLRWRDTKDSAFSNDG